MDLVPVRSVGPQCHVSGLKQEALQAGVRGQVHHLPTDERLRQDTKWHFHICFASCRSRSLRFVRLADCPGQP